jgi:hypothetical protein
MNEDDNVKIRRWKPKSKGPIGRPKICSEDDIMEDIEHGCTQLEECSTEQS